MASNSGLSRRRFVQVVGLGAVGAATAIACGDDDDNGAAASATAEHGAATTGASPPPDTQSAADADAAEEAKIKAFPAATEGLGGQPLAFEMDGQTKVFRLTCEEIEWEVEPGTRVKAMGYNGVLPGPEIRVNEGDPVRVIVTNNMAESTSVHWHGQRVPNAMDGVAFLTQPPILPGETFTYEWIASPSGTHMYHSHLHALMQVQRGLLGAIIVEPADASARPSFDKEYTLVLNDGALGFTINGKGFPATAPLTAKLGETVLIRYLNEGIAHHPMHLHGLSMEVIAVDGYPLPQPYRCDTLDIAPGNRYDVLVLCDLPGAWAFHCHVLTHVDTTNAGMWGMVTALIVEE